MNVAAGQVAQVLGTYGQYQERQLNEMEQKEIGLTFNPNVRVEVGHIHEGLDIATPADSSVRAVKAGVIEAIYRSPGADFDSFVVIRDIQADAQGQAIYQNGEPILSEKGWNYKHVKAREGLAVRDVLDEGAVLGTVGAIPANFPPGYGAHVHLDRGLAGTNPAVGGTRDQTMRKTGFYQFLLVKRATGNEKERVGASDAIKGYRWQYAPTINPLSEFLGNVTVPGGGVVVDAVRPIVNTIDFRLDADNGSKSFVKNPNTAQAVLEKVRDTDRYFQNQVSIGPAQYRQLGRYAVATASNGKTSGPNSDNNSQIDIVVSAYDQFGDFAHTGTQKLNPASIDFNVIGLPGDQITGNVNSGTIRSFDFSKVTGTPTPGVNDFFTLQKTRVIYENDKTHNSVTVATDPAGDADNPFWYIATNTRNVYQPSGKQPAMGEGMALSKESGPYWSTRGEQGNAFGAINSAASNATAAYPDGPYWVRVEATDLKGNNSDFKYANVLLTNWQRTIKTGKAAYRNDQAIVVTGGEQYRAGQAVDLYIIPADTFFGLVPTPLANNTALDPANKKATATTDATGKLPTTTLAAMPNGVYYVVADYNGDGIYTKGLDALIPVWVQTPPPPMPGMPPPPPSAATGLTLSSSLNPAHYTEAVTLTARFTYSDPNALPPAAQIAFFDGSTLLGVNGMNDGAATLDLSTVDLQWLAVGSHAITAYPITSGSESDYSASLTLVINSNQTTTTLAADSASSQHNGLVTFTATVQKADTSIFGALNGVVEFSADGEVFASVPVDSNGTASVIYGGLDRGPPAITAEYLRDTVFANSTSNSLTEVVANNAPVVAPDAVTTTDSAAVRVRVLQNDYDTDYDDLTVVAVSSPAHGIATYAADAVTYTPYPGFIGDDSFTYTAGDGFGGTSTATVIVRVLPQWGGSRVFADANGDGVQGVSERGIPLVLVNVYNSTGAVVASVLTDDNGYYVLPPDLLAGNYRLEFVLPPGMEQVPFTGRDLGGDDARDSDVDAAGSSGWFTFNPAQGWSDIDAGVFVDPNDPAYGYLFS